MEIIDEISAKNGNIRIINSFEGPVGAQHLVEVSGDGWKLHRWFFFSKFDEKKAKKFGAKAINNPTFRNACLNKNLNWSIIQELYLDAEKAIVSALESKSLFEYSPSDHEGERKAEWAEHKLIRMLKETYDSISYVISNLPLSPKDIEPYIEAQVEAAEGIARMIDQDSSAGVEEVRPADRLLECRSASTREWILEDDRVEILTITDVHPGEYRAVATLRSPTKKADAVKELDWHDTHHQWNPELGLWEVDLASLDQVINSFLSRNHIIRVSEPVARLADIDKPDQPDCIRPNWYLPTMNLNSYAALPSTTDLLILPGIGPYRARSLLSEGFMSIPEVAHSSVTNLSKASGIHKKLAQIAKEGATAAVGRREPSAVRLALETPLSIWEAQREIATLAAVGVPQSEATPTLVKLYQTNLPKIESIFGRKLYGIYRDGFHSVEDIINSEVSELARLEYIDQSLAESIHIEAEAIWST